MVRLLSALLLLTGFCLGAAISYFNWTRVTFDYLSGQVEVPLIALLLAAFLFGMAVMGLLNLAREWLLKREVRKLQTRLNLAETELKNLRNLPLAAEASSAAPGAQPSRIALAAAPRAPAAPGVPQGFPAVTSAGAIESSRNTPADTQLKNA